MKAKVVEGIQSHDSRRWFLRSVGAGAVLLLSGCAGRSRSPHDGAGTGEGAGAGEEGVTANEDLMREHGVLDRLLLVYEETRRRLADGAAFEPRALNRAAVLIRSFVEQYHEKLEEEHVFPRFEKAGRHADLVAVLRAQHEAGRRITDVVLQQTTAPGASVDSGTLIRAIEAFLRMYRPHAAREDTVLFPALHEIASAGELAELGEQFEELEERRFGAGGFEHVVSQVADLERMLGIHELSQFTPRLE